MRFVLLIIYSLILFSTNLVYSQPKDIRELPAEVQVYLEDNFKEYSFSKDLIESDRRIQENELTKPFLELPLHSHYFLKGDFNSEGKPDYLLNLFKEWKLENNNPKYSKAIEVRAILIYSDGENYIHHPENLSLGKGAARNNAEPKARSHFYLVEPGFFTIRDYRKGGFKEVRIVNPSIAIVNGMNLRVLTYSENGFSQIMVYDSGM